MINDQDFYTENYKTLPKEISKALINGEVVFPHLHGLEELKLLGCKFFPN